MGGQPITPEWLGKYLTPSNYIPGQEEIKYFFPLTEQIPLDLDYKRSRDYDEQKIVAKLNTSTASSIMINNGGTMSTWVKSNNIETEQLNVEKGIETSEITFTLNRKPFIITRLAYKLLGIKWKLK